MRPTLAISALALSSLVTACGHVAREQNPPPAPVATPAPAQDATQAPAPVAAPAPAPAAATKTYRPGVGVIESATVVALGSSSAAAEGGSSGPTMAYRLKMLDGTMQSVVQTGPRLEVGDRVEVTAQGSVTRR